jgi:hypothetical protein
MGPILIVLPKDRPATMTDLIMWGGLAVVLVVALGVAIWKAWRR